MSPAVEDKIGPVFSKAANNKQSPHGLRAGFVVAHLLDVYAPEPLKPKFVLIDLLLILEKVDELFWIKIIRGYAIAGDDRFFEARILA